MSKTRQKSGRFARDLDNEVQEAVHGGSKATSEKRYATLAGDYPDPDLLRHGGLIKQHTLDNLDRYLEQAVMALEDNGAKCTSPWTPWNATTPCCASCASTGSRSS
jgi:L-lactate dehydrogenase complex protein LldF